MELLNNKDIDNIKTKSKYESMIDEEVEEYRKEIRSVTFKHIESLGYNEIEMNESYRNLILMIRTYKRGNDWTQSLVAGMLLSMLFIATFAVPRNEFWPLMIIFGLGGFLFLYYSISGFFTRRKIMKNFKKHNISDLLI